MGVLWVHAQTFITRIRMAYINTPIRRFVEVLLICFLNTTLMVSNKGCSAKASRELSAVIAVRSQRQMKEEKKLFIRHLVVMWQ